MPRIRPITLEEAAPQVKAGMERNLETFGRVLPSTEVYGHAPSIQEGAQALNAGISDAGRISPQLRSLMNVRVAAMVGCPF
jgi:alkylhydroperoxidase family enzyme